MVAHKQALSPLRRVGASRWFMIVSIGVLAFGMLVVARAATPVAAGYKDFKYGTSGLTYPTGEKPESKLWFHDGLWWGSLYNPTAQAFHIYKLDPTKLSTGWQDTGVALDDRNSSRADVLLDGSTLYVVSHSADEDAVSDDPAKPKYFYRYSYNSGSKTWTKQAGPIAISNGSSETLVIAKDSTGQLWVTWVEAAAAMTPAQVMVATSSDNGATWTAPFVLPVPGANNLWTDDISTIVAYQGRIGIMWSNQTDKKIYFAVHSDSSADQVGWQAATAYSTASGDSADDHINLKVQQDASGRLFAVIKTSLNSDGAPDIVVLECLSGACDSPTSWTDFPVYPSTTPQSNEHTRPVLVVDSAKNQLHVFTAQPTTGGAIYRKSAAIGAAFDTGPGTAFIQGGSGVLLNDPTTTKQTATSQSGIVVLASDGNDRDYYFGYLGLSTTPPTNLKHKDFLPLVAR